MLLISFLVCGAKPVWHGNRGATTQRAAEATERQATHLLIHVSDDVKLRTLLIARDFDKVALLNQA